MVKWVISEKAAAPTMAEAMPGRRQFLEERELQRS